MNVSKIIEGKHTLSHRYKRGFMTSGAMEKVQIETNSALRYKRLRIRLIEGTLISWAFFLPSPPSCLYEFLIAKQSSSIPTSPTFLATAFLAHCEHHKHPTWNFSTAFKPRLFKPSFLPRRYTNSISSKHKKTDMQVFSHTVYSCQYLSSWEQHRNWKQLYSTVQSLQPLEVKLKRVKKNTIYSIFFYAQYSVVHC